MTSTLFKTTFFKTLTIGLLLTQVLAGCKSSEKPFPDNTYGWNPRTEKPFPDNISLPDLRSEKPEAAANNSSTKESGSPSTAISQFTITQPTSFSGKVPCKDCEYIQLYLTLRPDQVFFLRKEFEYRTKHQQKRFQELGGWQISADGKTLVLKRQDNSQQSLQILNTRQLEVLDSKAKPINQHHEYVLSQQENTVQLIDSAELTGLYFEDNGRGYWQECQSGVTWPIARAGDYKQISNKYLTLYKTAEKQTFVTNVTAHLVMQQDEYSTTTEYLVVDELKKMENKTRCPAKQ